MALQVTIDGIDKTDSIKANSLEIKNILTNKRDNSKFIVEQHSGESYVPKMGREVIITNNGTKVFGGVITSIESRPVVYKYIEHHVKCQDYTRLLDTKLVPDTFKNKTVNEIMQLLKDNYFPAGFTINNVKAPVEIDYVAFNYKPISKCIEELADTINYDWYVDYDKDIHFFAKNEKIAPFSLNDDDGSYEYNSLVIRKDNSQIRNQIVVRGGQYEGSQLTVERTADGNTYIFDLPYQFSDFSATLTGKELNVGIDYINNPDDFDALHNFNEKLLRFKKEDKPSTDATLSFGGKPNLPVIVKYKSQEHIDATSSAEGGDGVREYLIEDKSIGSKEGARQRAQAEILAYAETLTEGEFKTETDGLKAGQKITVNSTSRGINENYIINKVTISQFGSNTLKYHVSLLTTRTFDLIDVLQRLLLESTKKIQIKEDEVIDLVEGFTDETVSFSDTIASAKEHNPQSETMNMNETFTAQSLNYDVQFVVGPQTPSGTKRVFIIGGSRLG